MWRLRKQIHAQWRVALTCLGFVIGVAFTLLTRIYWQLGIVALLFVLLSFWHARGYVLPVLFTASFFVGLGYGSAVYVERSQYARYINEPIQISGRVKEDIGKTASGKASVQLDEVSISGHQLPGAVLVTISKLENVKRGDLVTISGTAKEGFGSFPLSVSGMSVVRVVHPVPGDVGRVVRDWFADNVRAVIPEPQASLGIGFLTGQKSALPDSLAEALKIAGLTHIVVASGYNLTILVQMSRKLFIKVSKYLSALSSSIMILMFMAITGLSPSMTRAGLVSGLSLMSWYYGRAFSPFVLLPFAAAITIAIQPSYAWGDLGWQLSFSAFAAVMFVAPLLQRYFFGKKEPSVIRQILGETIAAHAVTVPVIALSFGTMSNVAIVANLLVVPFVPLAMLLTFLCGVLVIAGFPFVQFLATPTTWLLEYMTNVAMFVASLSWAQFSIEVPGWIWGVYAIGIGALCLWMYKASAGDKGG